MTRLDRHVNTVRNKLALGTFLSSAGWALLAFAVVVWVNILVDRFLAWRLPRWGIWFFAGLGISVAAAVAYTIWRRPSRRQAAIAIDERLGLKEKFSTALYVRPMNDPFAAAAVRDAERTADNVSLHKRFPVPFPRVMTGTLAMMIVAVLTGWLLGPHPLFANDAAAKNLLKQQETQQLADTRKILDAAVAKIDSTPKTESTKETIEAARREILAHRDNPHANQELARQSAAKAMADMDAIKQKVKEAQKYASAQNELKDFRDKVGKPADDNTPVGKIQSEIAKGEFQKAVSDLGEVVKKFDNMKSEDQQKAAKDMEQLSKQLQKIANDKDKQQQIQQALQQMGASQQQMQQLASTVQAAAGGDKQAQQQVQQMANQIAQNINSNPNLTPQQQQQIGQQVKSLVNQMQGAANNQATAQQMSQAAKQLAQAMQQKAQQNAQQGGNKGGQTQSGGQQQQASSGSQGGKQGQQQPGGSKSGGQNQGAQQQAQGGGQGSQPGGKQGQQNGKQGQGQGDGQQNLADAAQQMQDQLEQLQQAADDNQQIAQGQGPDGQGQAGGQDEAQEGELRPNNGQGPFGEGANLNKGGGSGGPGVSAGGPRPRPTEAPFAVKREQAPSQTIQNGKILASTLVKSLSHRGESKVQASDVIESAKKEATDEVEQNRVSKPAQSVVKRYFDDLKNGVDEEQQKQQPQK